MGASARSTTWRSGGAQRDPIRGCRYSLARRASPQALHGRDDAAPPGVAVRCQLGARSHNAWTETEDAELDEEFALRYDSGAKHPDAGLSRGSRRVALKWCEAQLGLDPGSKTAVIFSHVLWDANMFYGEDLFEDQETWLVETVRAACANPEVDWVVKLHPANLYKAERELNDKIAIRERVGELPRHVKLLEPDTDLNTFSLFSVADYGITIRGTVGMELPALGARSDSRHGALLGLRFHNRFCDRGGISRPARPDPGHPTFDRRSRRCWRVATPTASSGCGRFVSQVYAGAVHAAGQARPPAES